MFTLRHFTAPLKTCSFKLSGVTESSGHNRVKSYRRKEARRCMWHDGHDMDCPALSFRTKWWRDSRWTKGEGFSASSCCSGYGGTLPDVWMGLLFPTQLCSCAEMWWLRGGQQSPVTAHFITWTLRIIPPLCTCGVVMCVSVAQEVLFCLHTGRGYTGRPSIGWTTLSVWIWSKRWPFNL